MAGGVRCNYMVASILCAQTLINSSQPKQKFAHFTAHFGESISSQHEFVQKSNRLVSYAKKAKIKGAKREAFIAEYGPEKWLGLNSEERAKHSINCGECSKTASLFPSAGPGRKKKPRRAKAEIPKKVVIDAA